MKQKGIERLLVIFLFILVLVVFSFAEKDSRKLERLYKSAQLLKEEAPPATVHIDGMPAQKANP